MLLATGIAAVQQATRPGAFVEIRRISDLLALLQRESASGCCISTLKHDLEPRNKPALLQVSKRSPRGFMMAGCWQRPEC